MTTDAPLPLPYRPRAGDVTVAVPHTLPRATRARFEAAARAVLPSAASFSRAAPDPRFVLDARECAVVDGDGLATIAGLLRAAAASGVGALVVDAAADVARLLARSPAARGLTIAFAARPPEAAVAPVADPAIELAGEVVHEIEEEPGPEPDVLPLDDAARRRLTARRRRPSS